MPELGLFQQNRPNADIGRTSLTSLRRGPELTTVRCYYGTVRRSGGSMRRRVFITLLSSAAAAWPLVARAQQPTAPVIGFLRPTKAEQSGHLVAAFRQGLRESGYPGDKVSIEARWADGRAERLPKLAAELVALQVSAIVGNVDAALAAKAATTSIPIVFVTGGQMAMSLA